MAFWFISSLAHSIFYESVSFALSLVRLSIYIHICGISFLSIECSYFVVVVVVGMAGIFNVLAAFISRSKIITV